MMRFCLTLCLSLLLIALAAGSAGALTPQQELGKKLFFDNNLSTSPGQACAACHAPNTGFVGPVSDINAHGAVYPGAIHTRFGNRKPPTSAYASFSPDFHFSEEDGLYEGGMFWDGRALNTIEQAKGPFLNPLEMNNPNMRSVVGKVLRSDYAPLFKQVFIEWKMQQATPDAIPEIVFDLSSDVFVGEAYQFIAESIAEYEASPEVNQFSSKYDAYLAGTTTLTAQEAWGLELFEGKANCSACHPSEPDLEEGHPPLFTDFTYDNLGVPKNLENPFYGMPPGFNPAGENWVDLGLGGRPGFEDEIGKMKVPTLRNVGMRPYAGFVQAYSHNGYFKSLEEIVNFYNTRDLGGWPDPEVAENVNHNELGNLGLTADEVAAVVAFLNTLTDGWVPEAAPMIASAGSVRLLEAAPNPFQALTQLRFDLPTAGPVRVMVYDANGRVARTLSTNLGAGLQVVPWDGRNDFGQRVAPGVYFYRLDGRQRGGIQRVVLIP
jgi:cytochrome c peroxidase